MSPTADGGAARAAEADNGPQKGCVNCTNGALVEGGRMRCCTCTRGRERALNLKRASDADRGHEARLKAGRGRQGRAEPMAKILERLGEKARVLRMGVRDPVPGEAAAAV